MSAPTTTKVLWHEPSKLLGLAWVVLPVGVALSSCLIGLPLAARAIKGLAHLALSNARALRGQPAPGDPEKSYAGSVGLLVVAPFGVVPMLVGLLAADRFAEGDSYASVAVGLGAAVVSAMVLGAALASLLFAPIVAAAGAPGFFAPFGRSFEVAAARGARPTLWLGLRVGTIFGVWFAAFGHLGYYLDGQGRIGPPVLLGLFAVMTAAPRALALLANVWADLDEDATVAGASTGQLRGLAWMILPALLALGASFAVAAFVPIPLHRGESPAPQQRGFHPEVSGGYVQSGRLPGTSVRVRVLERGIAVEADDGGGAGELEVDFETSQGWLIVEQRTRQGRPVDEFRVAVSNGEQWASTIVDADGVRLDDSTTDRTFGRLGRLGSAGLAVAALCLLFLTFTVGVELGEARRLHAPALLEGERAPEGLAALEGTLRIGEDSRAFHRRAPPLGWLIGRTAKLWVEGEAWIEAADGAIRFRLPDRPVEVVGGASIDDWSGVHVVLLSRFPSAGVAGMRQAAATWPDDGRITLGRREDARRALVQRAVRRASRVALPMLAGVGVAVLTLVLAL